MENPAALDPDLLRAFAFIAEEGSFTRAAERVGRTQSAVSMQIQRLEQLLRQKLLLRGKGGSVTLTAHGAFLLEKAREMLALNDSIWRNFCEPELRGVVRLGTPDDYAMRFLPGLLRSFAESHPSVDVDVICEPSSQLVGRLRDDQLDLTLLSEGHEPRHWEARELWRGKLRWITSDRHAPHRRTPLPVALAGHECSWRTAALGALERAGIAYRVAYTSASQAGTMAPVMAGLAVTVSPIDWLPDGLRAMRPDEGLPEMPDFGILMLRGRNAAAAVTDALEAHIAEAFKGERQHVVA